ncbi:MAG: hypothetical protein JRI73_05040 [Deltaproteobacteria bacterium]|jgi:hypothetical protein|nr:hypothetical protein [Deltaproteobacteria bacterium]
MADKKTCHFGDPSFLHFLVQTGTYFLAVEPGTAKVEDDAASPEADKRRGSGFGNISMKIHIYVTL